MAKKQITLDYWDIRYILRKLYSEMRSNDIPTSFASLFWAAINMFEDNFVLDKHNKSDIKTISEIEALIEDFRIDIKDKMLQSIYGSKTIKDSVDWFCDRFLEMLKEAKNG